jgi:hypothetical protein
MAKKKKGSLMAQQCPLIFRQVDATVTRINTLFVMSGVIAYLVSGIVAILLFLTVDFALRLYGVKHLSPIQNVSLWIQRRLSLPSRMEDAGAKRLAALFGIGFVAAMALFHFLGIAWAVNAVAVIYLFCAALDLFFGYCIACKLYHWTKKIYPKGFE